MPTMSLLFLAVVSLLYLHLEGAQAFCIVTKWSQKLVVVVLSSSATTSAGATPEFQGESSPNSRRRRRSSTTDRKPKYYWNDIENVKKSFYEFWEDLNVTTINSNAPPIIPSETLLNHFERHDLRQVISKYGGREDLSDLLGGAEIIPGKWKDAVCESEMVQELLRNGNFGLQPDLPPLSPQQKKMIQENYCLSDSINVDDNGSYRFAEESAPIMFLRNNTQIRWSYQNKETRKPLGYWTLPVLIEELYNHLDDVRVTQQRPAVWMQRPSEIREAGREDLFHALARVGRETNNNKKDIAKIAGLVPYRECRYFEDQLQLMKELTMYLDEFYSGNHTVFPTATEIKADGYLSLFYAIQRYGGRKFLMSRFGMIAPDSGSSLKNTNRKRKKINLYTDLRFGPFSIDFAIQLLEYIRNHHLHHLKAPLKPAMIRMPSEYELFQSDRNDLIEGIQKYGGYENVARRLGLAYFEKKVVPPTSVGGGGGSTLTSSPRRRVFRQ